MNIKTIKVGILETNCYILEKNNTCLIIDPGDELEKICKEITCTPVAILVTHRHFDHIGALNKISSKYNIPIYEHNNLMEEKIKINDFDIEIIYTPGHTKDSITYYFYKDNVMFTGDFLFKESIGRTDLDTGNVLDMKNSIQKIKKFDNNIKVYPGHGDSTILQYEKQNNIYLR